MDAYRRFRETLRTSIEVIGLVWSVSKRYTIYTTALLTIGAVIPVVEAYFIKRIIDTLTASRQEEVAFAVVVTYLVLFIATTIISRVIESQRNTAQIVLGNLFNKEINQRLIEKTAKLPFWKFEDSKFQDKLDRIRDQATWKPLNMFYYLFGMMRDVLMLVTIFAVLLAFNPPLLILMVVFAIPSLIVQLKYGHQWWNLIHMETPESRRLNYYQHLMSGRYEMKDIKLLNLRETLVGRYKMLYDKLFNEQKRLVIKRLVWELLTYLLADVILVLFYFHLAWQAYLRKVTIGDFTFYSTTYLRGVSALHGIVRDASEIYENNLFVSELLEYLGQKEEEGDDTGKKPPEKIERMGFRDVWFRYPGTENWILQGISFELKPGKSVALVGENGAGKTTIVKLLTRLYEPTKGDILLNGVPVREFNVRAYRDLIGVSFQDFARFYFTVRDNITMGDIGRTFSQQSVEDIAKKAGIHEKIERLPKKYDTVLGRWYDEGQEISYGEWQRIAIARALIKDCPIYVLDEPTAALDAKAEYLVFREFKEHVKGKIAMFISHRFSNVRLADEILVLEGGVITQRGTHEQLASKDGTYKKLYEYQARSYRE